MANKPTPTQIENISKKAMEQLERLQNSKQDDDKAGADTLNNQISNVKEDKFQEKGTKYFEIHREYKNYKKEVTDPLLNILKGIAIKMNVAKSGESSSGQPSKSLGASKTDDNSKNVAEETLYYLQGLHEFFTGGEFFDKLKKMQPKKNEFDFGSSGGGGGGMLPMGGNFLIQIGMGFKYWGVHWKDILKGVLTFSAALLIIGSTLVILTKILEMFGGKASIDQMMTFGFVLVTMGGFMWAYSKIMDKVDTKALLRGAGAMALIAGSMFLVAVAFKIINDMDFLNANFFVKVGVVLLTMAVLGASLIAVGKLGPQIWQGALAIALMGVALTAVAYAFTIIDKINMDGIWKKMGVLAVAIMGTAVLFGVIGIPAVSGAVALGSAVAIAMALALVVTSKALNGLSSLSVGVKEIFEFGKVIVSLAIMFAIVGAVSILAIPGTIAVMLMAPAIALIAGALGVASAIKLDPKNLIAFGVSLIVLAGIFTGIGALSTLITPGAMTAMWMALATVLIGTAIGIINTFKLNLDNLGKFGIALVGLGTIYTGLGIPVVAGLITLGAVAALSMAVASIKVMQALKLMMALDPDKVSKAMPTFKNVLTSLFDVFKALSAGESFNIGIVSKFVQPLATTLKDFTTAIKQIQNIDAKKTAIGTKALKSFLFGESYGTTQKAFSEDSIFGLFSLIEKQDAKKIGKVAVLIKPLAETLSLLGSSFNNLKSPPSEENIKQIKAFLFTILELFSDPDGSKFKGLSGNIQALGGFGDVMKKIVESFKDFQKYNPGDNLAKFVKALNDLAKMDKNSLKSLKANVAEPIKDIATSLMSLKEIKEEMQLLTSLGEFKIEANAFRGLGEASKSISSFINEVNKLKESGDVKDMKDILSKLKDASGENKGFIQSLREKTIGNMKSDSNYALEDIARAMLNAMISDGVVVKNLPQGGGTSVNTTNVTSPVDDYIEKVSKQRT